MALRFEGVGYPLDIVVCSALGADMYDCVYPTRTARFGTALVPEGVLKLKQNSMATDERPIDPTCPCMVCKKYTRPYLHCLITKDPMGSQLLSYHNLSFMMRLSRDLHLSILEGRFPEYVRGFLRVQFPKGDVPKWVRNAMEVAGIDISECCTPTKCQHDVQWRLLALTYQSSALRPNVPDAKRSGAIFTSTAVLVDVIGGPSLEGDPSYLTRQVFTRFFLS